MQSSRSIRAAVACVALAITSPTLAEDPAHADRPPPKARHHHKAAADDAPAATTGGGNASYYSRQLAGKKTASGQRYDPEAMTAAHRTLPLGTQVKVVNPKTDQSVVVTVNDRGPVPKNRVLDVSSAAADKLGMKKSGVTKVETEVVGKTDLPKGGEPAGGDARH